MGDSNDKRDVALDETIDSSPPDSRPPRSEKSAIESGETLHASEPPTPQNVSVDATLASQSNARERAAPVPLPEVARDSYVIERELARGGMGRILVAEDRRLARPVALKELLVANAALADRFSREVRITARLQHPGIVPVYEAGHWPGGEPFYAMKLVSGRSLEKVVQERVTLEDRLRLVPNLLQLAEAMAYAHDRRIIHRDLKPANVLVGEYGETVVIDWGLAKDLDEADEVIVEGGAVVDSTLTQVGAVVGTPAYMAPEQARGEKVDARADVYALGALMWHVLAGRSPVSGSSVDTVIQRVRDGVATRPLVEVEPAVPPELATIVDHAMASNPAARYPTARELAADLSAFQTGKLVATHEYSVWQHVRRWIRQHRTAVLATLALIVGAAVVGVFALRQVVTERDKARTARVTGLEEQGRVEMKAGRPRRAAVYLAEAYRSADAPDDGLRVMLGEAMRAVDRAVATWRSSKWIIHVAWLDDERVLAIADDGSITAWDIATDTRTELLAPDEQLRSAAQVVMADEGGVVAIRGARTLAIVVGAAKPVLVPLRTELSGVAISPSGQSIAVASNKPTLLFDKLGALRGTGQAAATATARVAIAFDRNNQLVEVSEQTMNCGDRTYTTDKEEILELSPTPRRLGRGSLSRSWCGRARSMIETSDERIAIVDGANLRYLDTTSPEVAALDASGTFASTGSADGTVAVWDLASGLLLWTLDAHSRGVQALAFDRGSKRLASVGADGVLHVWKLDAPPIATTRVDAPATGGGVTARISRDTVVVRAADGTERTLTGHDELVSWIAVSPKGDAITAGARDGRILRWDPTGRTLARWEQPSAVTDGSVWGSWLAVAGNDGTVHVWRDRELVAQLGGHTSPVHAVQWSPSGDRLLSAADSTLRLWRPTGELLAHLPCEQTIGKAWWIGERYVVVAGERSLQLWDVDRSGIAIELRHGHETQTSDTAVAGEHGALVAGRVGWTGVATWAFTRETRPAATIATLVDARIPWRLVDGALVPEKQTALATAELIRAGKRSRYYDFSGEEVSATPGAPDFSDLVGSGAISVVRDATVAIRRGDRANAAVALAGIDDTGAPNANLALAWCRHWLGEHAAAYAAARLALAAWTDTDSLDEARTAALRFAAWAAIKPDALVADVKLFGVELRTLRFSASRTYEEIGKLDLAAELVEIPPITEREPRLRALFQLARISNGRADPNGAVGFLETAAKLGPFKMPLEPTPKCGDVALELRQDDPILAVGELTRQLAGASFSTFSKTFDHRYARAARKLYSILRDSYGFDAAFVTTCLEQLDSLASDALTRSPVLDKALLRRAFKARLETVRACYRRHLAIEPYLAGTLFVRFTAIPSGKVEQVDVVADSDRPLLLELAACVRERLADIGLPRLATGDSTIVNYPLTFRPE
ncbi:MAG: protein kinase domain-containing protein [Kofleriaceae bacterium]